MKSPLVSSALRSIAKKALAIVSRGAVPNDVLELGKISIHQLQLEWRARDIHPWDRDIPFEQQEHQFCDMALQDTELALVGLFEKLPYVEQIDFRVFEPGASDRVIIAGCVEREEFMSAQFSQSIRMRLKMMGVRFNTAGDRLRVMVA
jgi:hypothetical protein